MFVKVFVFNPFGENCYVVYNEQKQAIVIDPGFCNESERREFSSFVKENDLTICNVLNTHLHIDHAMGNRFVTEEYGVVPQSGKEDENILRNMGTYAKLFGLTGRFFTEDDFDKYMKCDKIEYLSEGDVVRIPGIELHVLHVPGHTMGHLVFWEKDEKCCFVGDVVFRGSIGRTDLAGFDEAEMQKMLINNIKKKILTMDEETVLFCGHGASTTVADEKQYNSYLV